MSLSMKLVVGLIFDWVVHGVSVTYTFGMDVDYPPYAFRNDTSGELEGFGKDFADGMTALCSDITINVVEARWSDCWDGSTPSIGQGLNNGTYDACMTYTHTQGVRNVYCDFSDAILDVNKAAGLLVELNAEGLPKCIDGDSDLAGKTVVDVSGWAPTADTIANVTNKCTNTLYSDSLSIISTSGTGNANDEALQKVLDGTADAMFVYADQAYHYKSQCDDNSDQAWNCTAWSGFGTKFAYAQTGQFGYSINGTTLALTKKGSGVAEAVNPCLHQFMATKEYYDICVKHGFEKDCFPNQYFPANTDPVKPYMQPTNEHTSGCSDGYCSCTHSGTCGSEVLPDSVVSAAIPAASSMHVMGAALAFFLASWV